MYFFIVIVIRMPEITLRVFQKRSDLIFEEAHYHEFHESHRGNGRIAHHIKDILELENRCVLVQNRLENSLRLTETFFTNTETEMSLLDVQWFGMQLNNYSRESYSRFNGNCKAAWGIWTSQI